MKWPFSRKKDVSAVPAEIQDYYQTERRERTGIAWLLALGTLLITIALAALLFFGGRWVYRTVFDNDDDTQETAQTDQDQEGSEGADATEGAPAEPSSPSTGTSSTNTSTPNTPSGSTSGSQTTPSTSTQSATTTPVTGDDDLPNTGPGDVVAIFAATTIAATAAHYAISTRRTEQ